MSLIEVVAAALLGLGSALVIRAVIAADAADRRAADPATRPRRADERGYREAA